MTTTADWMDILHAELRQEYGNTDPARTGETVVEWAIRLLREHREFQKEWTGPGTFSVRARSRPSLLWVWDRGMTDLEDHLRGERHGWDIQPPETDVLAAYLRWALREVEAQWPKSSS